MPADYTLTVKDFGPIADATVNLRPLTVFVGPSNTGKSYLAGLLYALHRTLHTPRHMYHPGAIFMGRQIPFTRATRLPKKLREDIEKWVSACSGLRQQDPIPPAPSSALEHVEGTLEDPQRLSDALTGQVARCFGVDDAALLARHGSESSVPSLELQIRLGDGKRTRFQADLGGANGGKATIETDGTELPDPTIRELANNARSYVFLDEGADEALEEKIDAREFLNQLTERAFVQAFSPLIRCSAYYLPADRTGVMHSHHVVVSALVQRASLAGIRRFDDVPMLSGVMADFLDLLVSHISQLERRPPQSAKVRALAKAMEERILRGEIRVNLGEVDYPSFAYRPTGWQRDLPLMQASSMVSELAPIVLYLRHVVRPDDILIIEEPESHLHPAMQAALARELARLVNAGIRVVMTTHSEWFLEQFGNLVRASDLPSGKRPSRVSLRQDQVGAWLFQPGAGAKGSVVSEVTIDPETGLYATDYDAVSDALYNDSAKIADLLQADASE